MKFAFTAALLVLVMMPAVPPAVALVLVSVEKTWSWPLRSSVPGADDERLCRGRHVRRGDEDGVRRAAVQLRGAAEDAVGCRKRSWSC